MCFDSDAPMRASGSAWIVRVNAGRPTVSISVWGGGGTGGL